MIYYFILLIFSGISYLVCEHYKISRYKRFGINCLIVIGLTFTYFLITSIFLPYRLVSSEMTFIRSTDINSEKWNKFALGLNDLNNPIYRYYFVETYTGSLLLKKVPIKQTSVIRKNNKTIPHVIIEKYSDYNPSISAGKDLALIKTKYKFIVPEKTIIEVYNEGKP